MKDAIVKEITRAASSRVRVREVPTGFRISLPFVDPDHHLVELSVRREGDRYVIWDAGQLDLFIQEKELALDSEKVKATLERLTEWGWNTHQVEDRPVLEHEIPATIDTPRELGVQILDMAFAYANALWCLPGEAHARPKDFESEIRGKLRALKQSIVLGAEIAGVEVPWRLRQTNVAGAIVGSYGETVDKYSRAWKQLQPLVFLDYKLRDSPSTERFTKVALVKGDFGADERVRSTLETLGVRRFDPQHWHEFRRFAKGEGRLSLD